MLRWLATLALPAILLVGCTGTPMPIPPSFRAESLEVDSTDPTPECPGECSVIHGLAEDGVVVVAHRTDFTLLPEPETAFVGVDLPEAGDFSVVVGGSPEGFFRAIVHNADGYEAIDFEALSGAPTTVVDDQGLAGCIHLSPDALDFGRIETGDTATDLVELRNDCGRELILAEAGAFTGPTSEEEPAFAAMSRGIFLEDGEETTVVVAFWPEVPGEHWGALLFMIEDPDMGGALVPSIPIRGEAD